MLKSFAAIVVLIGFSLSSTVNAEHPLLAEFHHAIKHHQAYNISLLLFHEDLTHFYPLESLPPHLFRDRAADILALLTERSVEGEDATLLLNACASTKIIRLINYARLVLSSSG